MNRGGLALFFLCATLSVVPAQQDTRRLDTGIVEHTGSSLMLLDVDVVDEQGRPLAGAGIGKPFLQISHRTVEAA